MDLQELLKVLNVEVLDESKQIEIKEKLDTIVDVSARERADEIIKEEKEKLVEEYEDKFDEYKTDITSKFSSFVDSILDEELQIPEKVLKYAHKGELYDDLIEQFKTKLSIDEGVLDKEVKGILKEAKDEILSLKEQMNELIAENMEIKDDATKMASNLYLRKKCDGLTESQKNKVVNLLGDLKEKTEIDRKFKYIVEGILSDSNEDGTLNSVVPLEEPEAEAATNTNVCVDCGAVYSAEGEDSEIPESCPKCGGKFKSQDDEVKPADDLRANDGLGVVGNVEKPTEVEESNDPFKEQMKRWKTILKENRF